MIKVGVTGGIGCGKTTVCKVFEILGVPVYYADQKAKHLMESDTSIISKIKSIFGEEAYENDMLNRSHISEIVFNNKEKLDQLNKIVHPAVLADSEHWMQRHKDHDYVIKEAALLIQSGSYKLLDFIVLITAPENLRIERVMLRDNLSRDMVSKRMENQWTENEMSQFSDFSISNDGDHMLIPQVLQLHNVFTKLANPPNDE